jgi:uncharacterized protein YukE
MSDRMGHDTALMAKWATKLQGNTDYYDQLVRKLYTTVDSLVGTDFNGGLSEDFRNNIESKKKDFTDYSDTFSDCIKYINSRVNTIESDEQFLKNKIESENLM